MTRHAEMERPDEVQEAEFAARGDGLTNRLAVTFKIAAGSMSTSMRRSLRRFQIDMGIPLHKREPYSRLRERTVYDPTYRPRHMNHRADVSA